MSELEDLFAKREPGCYDHSNGHLEYKRDVATIAALCTAPRSVIVELFSAHEVPAAERAAFLLAYRPPAGIADVWETARAVAAWLRGDRSARGVASRVLLEAQLELFPDPALAQLLQFAARGDIRAKAFAKKLGL